MGLHSVDAVSQSGKELVEQSECVSEFYRHLLRTNTWKLSLLFQHWADKQPNI
jgi:hypothetical protein